MPRTLATSLLLASVALALGCSEPAPDDMGGLLGPRSGGQFGEETFYCVPVNKTPVDLGDDSTPLGIDVAGLLDSVEGDFRGTMQWEDSSSAGTLALAFAGTVEVWTRAAGEERAPSENCPDVVMIALEVVAQTDDGRLDESWTVATYATSSGSATQRFEVDGFAGSLDVASFAPAGVDSPASVVDLMASTEGVTVLIEGQGEVDDGANGPDDAIGFVSFEVGVLVAGPPD